MKIVYQEDVVALTRDDPNYKKWQDNVGILCHVFRIKNPECFVVENLDLEDGTRLCYDQKVIIDTKKPPLT